ncbi:tellurite resistance TerB family protein [Methylobacterium planeticum]|uniref:Tellurite resistance protein TerB n=1 Tax=Methylobacterium planeticum TaxID=2615211 RepID=A0A6N6MTG1_9HYPH|nr:Tellurite resistance protein TerB [Methylobacterium planeticum]KAB1073907.1 Tellurite resistance protein TerB [Methylobacterium planeticum]
MSIFQDAILRFGRTIMSYAGDAVFLEAAVSAAANVTLADGEIDEEEIESAITGMRANPILEKSYDTLHIEQALYEAIARARTRAGRIENIRLVSAIADRPATQRQDVFLIAADVADFGGISEVEHKVLDEIALALKVDKAALLG